MLRSCTTIIFLSFSVSALAAPQKLPPQLTLQDIPLQRCSVAPIKALKVFKIGYASVYMQDCSALTVDFFGAMKQFSIEYHREVPGSAFADAAADFLRKNLTPEAWTELRSKAETFNSHYRDIGPGDRYDLVYLPGNGLRLLLNGELLAEEADAEFAQAYFTIWFGEHPYDRALKSRLLKRG